MIVAASSITEIPEGKFVCEKARVDGWICGYPRKVTHTTDKRVHFMKGDPPRETYAARASIAYVCDTLEEGLALYNLGLEREAAINKAKEEAARAVRAEFAPRVKVLLGSNTEGSTS